MSDYPVGAKWVAEDKSGNRGTIWLDERGYNFEIWKWGVRYHDGSTPRNSFDWGTTKRFVREECTIALRGMGFIKPRFKRVKELPDV